MTSFSEYMKKLKIENVLAEFSSTGPSQSTQDISVCFENVDIVTQDIVCFENVLWTKIQPIHFRFLIFHLFRGRGH